MLLTGFSGLTAYMTIFIFNLDPDDRSAVLIHLPFYLLIQRLPVPSRQRKIRRIIAAKRDLLFQQPVRKSTVSHFSMAPWSDPQEHRKIQFLTDSQKLSNIPASGKIIYAFLFLMVDPECIGGNYRNSSCFHLPQ